MTDDMADLGVPKAARRLWRALAGDSTVLSPGTSAVVRGSRYICPPGWTGVVRLGNAVIIEAGDANGDVLAILRALDDPSDPNAVAETLAPTRTRGPGILAYLADSGDTLHHRSDPDVVEVPLPAITEWLDALPQDDVDESSLRSMDDVVVLTRGTDIVAAAGHVEWPATMGHVGVLVAPTARGQGGSGHGWARSRPAASSTLAASLNGEPRRGTRRHAAPPSASATARWAASSASRSGLATPTSPGPLR